MTDEPITEDEVLDEIEGKENDPDLLDERVDEILELLNTPEITTFPRELEGNAKQLAPRPPSGYPE